VDPTIDVGRRLTEDVARMTREYMDRQRSAPGGAGRSADGSVEVTLDGLGDITDVTVHAKDLPPEVARRLALAFRQAWMDAARQVATHAAENSPVARRAGMAEFVQEQITTRYGDPAETTEKPRRDRGSMTKKTSVSGLRCFGRTSGDGERVSGVARPSDRGRGRR
jgi:hypothetical protein